MPPYPLTNFEIQKYYQNEPRFNGVFSRDNLPKKIKDGAYVINLDEYADVGTHWIALFCNKSEIVYFDSFGVEHVPEKIKEFIGHKNTEPNIFRVQANNSVMCGYFFIGFIDFILAGKKLTDFMNLFSPHDFEKNDVMNEIDRTNLTDQKKFRLNEISKIEKHFYKEINQRTSCSKKLSKYVAAFDCIEKVLIVSSATTGGVSIISFTSVVEASVGIGSASFISTIGIVKKLLSTTRNKKKKHDKILMLVKSKLNSTETLVSQALIDMELSHE